MREYAGIIQILLILMLSGSWLHASDIIADKSNIVIGLLIPPEEPAAASLRDGATLGVEEANQTAGPHSRLVIRGRAGQWGADGVEAARMATDDGAMGLIAPPDGAASHLVLQVSGRTAVPVISLCPDSSVTRTGIPWMLRIVPGTVDQAKLLFNRIHAAHWNIVVPDARNGREVTHDLKEAAMAAGCSIKQIIEANSSLTNMSSLSNEILSNHADAVLLWLDPIAAGRLARQLREVGYAGMLAGPDRLRSSGFQMAAGSAMQDFEMACPVLKNGDDNAAQHFTDTFRLRFGREPDAMAAASYDAARLLIRILQQSTNRPANESFPVTLFQGGASGKLSFDQQGNREANLQIFVGRSGRFVPAERDPNQ